MPDIREYMKSKKEGKDSSFIKKLLIHRVAVFYKIVILIVALIAIGVGIYVYFENKVYTKYNVISSVERTDTQTTTYYKYAQGILKCSSDGASYTDYSNKVIWNQTFEMNHPMIDICNDYVAIADKEGNKVYIFNTKGYLSEINVNLPIEKLQVASQGVVYVILNDGTGSKAKVFSKEGEELAKSDWAMVKSGYPIDIAVSDDGEKLGVSFLYVDSGIMKTQIGFFNFGSVGQNKIDNLVSAYPYESSVFPRIAYVNNTTAVAFGDKKIAIYKGNQIPEVVKEIEVQDEIRSIYYSDSYFALVFDNSDPGAKYRMELYDLEGNKVLNLKFDQDYNNIVINEKEFIIISEMGFSIYKMSGLEKFRYSSQKTLLNVMLEGASNRYVIIDSSNTQIINLKLN